MHYRQLARLMSRHTWLYTEMVVDSTLIHNPDRDRYLLFPPEQHPIVCQLGGSDPAKLAAAAKIVAEYNYDEINLNCGCPRWADRPSAASEAGNSLLYWKCFHSSGKRWELQGAGGTGAGALLERMRVQSG